MNVRVCVERSDVDVGIVVALGVTVMLWASSFTAIRAALADFAPGELAFLRFALASAALAGYACVARPALPRRADIPRVALAGALGIAFYNLALNTGQLTVSAGAAGFLINVSPVFSVLLGMALRGERVTRWGGVGIAASFTGVGLIAVGSAGPLTLGQGAPVILAAALCMSLQLLVQKPLLARYSPLAVTTGMIWAGTLFFLPFAPAALVAVPQASVQSLGAIVFLALGPGVTAYIAWAHVLSRLPISRAASFQYLVPPVSLLVAYAWLGEVPGAVTLAGGALALGGVVVVNTLGRVR